MFAKLIRDPDVPLLHFLPLVYFPFPVYIRELRIFSCIQLSTRFGKNTYLCIREFTNPSPIPLPLPPPRRSSTSAGVDGQRAYSNNGDNNNVNNNNNNNSNKNYLHYVYVMSTASALYSKKYCDRSFPSRSATGNNSFLNITRTLLLCRDKNGFLCEFRSFLSDTWVSRRYSLLTVCGRICNRVETGCGRMVRVRGTRKYTS